MIISDELKTLLGNLAKLPFQTVPDSIKTIDSLENYLMQLYPEYAEMYDLTFTEVKNSIFKDIENNFTYDIKGITLYYIVTLIGMVASLLIDSLKDKHKYEYELYLESLVWAMQALVSVYDYLQQECNVDFGETLL